MGSWDLGGIFSIAEWWEPQSLAHTVQGWPLTTV